MYAAQSDDATRMTETEYLAFEDESEIKHEFSRGKVYAMTGGSARHAIITLNVGTQLNIQLADGNCTATSPDLRVHIASRNAYRYPDVTVFCGDLVYVPDRTDTITNPVVLVEVLSPGTALTDLNDKLHEYTEIESLQAYLLVEQHQPRIQRYMRHDSGEWLFTAVSGLDAEIALPAIDCVLPLAKVYHKVSFDQPDDEDEPKA